MTSGEPVTPDDDPIIARRTVIARLVRIGQRLGYGLFGVAAAVFAIGALSGFTATITTLVVIALAVGSIVLAPAIVFGYAVSAADREDRERRSDRGLDP